MKYIRKCPACGFENQPDEIFCERCCGDISSITPEGFKGDSFEEPAQPDDQSGKGNGSARICPDCGAELDNQPHYPRCKRMAEGFTLVWQNSSLQPVRLSKDRPLFIGRVPPVDLELIQHFEESHKTISRNHAEISIGENGNPYLRDMNSVNGCFVNNQQVHPFVLTMLQVGDRISFSHSLSAVLS